MIKGLKQINSRIFARQQQKRNLKIAPLEGIAVLPIQISKNQCTVRICDMIRNPYLLGQLYLVRIYYSLWKMEEITLKFASLDHNEWLQSFYFRNR